MRLFAIHLVHLDDVEVLVALFYSLYSLDEHFIYVGHVDL